MWCAERFGTIYKTSFSHGCFSRFLNCTDGEKLPKTSEISNSEAYTEPSQPSKLEIVFAKSFLNIKSSEYAFEPSVLLHPDGNYMFKVNNRNTKTRCEICSKLAIKTP